MTKDERVAMAKRGLNFILELKQYEVNYRVKKSMLLKVFAERKAI